MTETDAFGPMAVIRRESGGFLPAPFPATDAPMRRLAVLVCTLMAAVLLWTGTSARAAEMAGCVEVSADATGHYEGDKDQVPSDPDKGAPHHHGGCQGHHVAIPSDGDAAALGAMLSNSVGMWLMTFTAGCDPGTALRPPIA